MRGVSAERLFNQLSDQMFSFFLFFSADMRARLSASTFKYSTFKDQGVAYSFSYIITMETRLSDLIIFSKSCEISLYKRTMAIKKT